MNEFEGWSNKLGEYFQSLLEQGFESNEALAIVLQYQEILLKHQLGVETSSLDFDLQDFNDKYNTEEG